MMDNINKEDRISLSFLIGATVLPLVGISSFIKIMSLYLNGVSFADYFEENFSSLLGKTTINESHIMGSVVESFDSLWLFHPVFIGFACLFFVSLYIYILIKYFNQKREEDV